MSRLRPRPLLSPGTILKVAVGWGRISREPGCCSVFKSFPPSAWPLPPSLLTRTTSLLHSCCERDRQPGLSGQRRLPMAAPISTLAKVPGLNPLCAGWVLNPTESGSRLWVPGLVLLTPAGVMTHPSPLPPSLPLSCLQHPSSLFQQDPCLFPGPSGHLLWLATVSDTKAKQAHLLVRGQCSLPRPPFPESQQEEVKRE